MFTELPSRNSSPSEDPKSGLKIGCTVRKPIGDQSSAVFYVAVYPQLAEKAGLKIHDRIRIFYDQTDRTGLIRKAAPNETGIKLSLQGGSKQGSNSVLRCAQSWEPGIPFLDESSFAESVEIKDEGILFVYPANTLFDADRELVNSKTPAMRKRFRNAVNHPVAAISPMPRHDEHSEEELIRDIRRDMLAFEERVSKVMPEEEIACVARELGIRKKSYPGNPNYTKEQAEYEIACMTSVLRTLRKTHKR